MAVVLSLVYSCEQCTAPEAQDMHEYAAREHLEANPTHTCSMRVKAYVEDEPGV